MTAALPPAVSEGSPEPLGATLTPGGLNLAGWSAHAEAIEVCLFGPDGQTETARIVLPGRTGPVFHGLISGVAAGARYGLRAHGAWAPEQGHRFNPAKLLVDPYAVALDRPFALHASQFGAPGEADGDADSAAFVPKAIVVAEPADAPPVPTVRRAWEDTVLYELHVRGFTKLNPDIPEAIRGTFAGLAHPAAIAHLTSLGVTAVEILPAAAWIDERHLPPLDLTNYWGYNPVALMVPDRRLAPGGWPEVRAAVAALAEAGIETIVDVVLNHTGEGDAEGPTLSFRGLDNAAYYRHAADDPGLLLNEAGTGNTLALNRAPGLRLAMDTLRTWRRLGGVAGFRFDLASAMGRSDGAFDPAAPLLAAIAQDPELRDLRLIAEPWDIGPGGYQLGAFPPAWGEWNDRFRDTVRGFWRGDGVSRGELARRLAGSEDVFHGRRPSRSVNFVTAHDGFTLVDLVAYAEKHNQTNGEDGRDGTNDNRSWNNGVEGPTDDPAIRAARRADQRAVLATLILARGTPMLAMGDEMGRSQGGNNNAYAQDNAAFWLDWATGDQGLFDFARRLLALRREHPALRRDRFLTGLPASAAAIADVDWRAASGRPLAADAWDDPAAETLVMALAEPDGDQLDRVVVALHRGAEAVTVALPEPRDGFDWSIAADTADPGRKGPVDESVTVAARSVVVLSETASPRRRARGTDPEALARLAAAAGVAVDWAGVDGARRTVTPETLQAVLAALDLPAGSTDQARNALGAFAESQARRPLPPVLVARTGAAVTLPLALGRGEPVGRPWLTITSETGEIRRVRARPEEMSGRMVEGADGRVHRAVDLTLPPLSAGYYAVVKEDRPDHPCRLIVAPARCHRPAALEAGGKPWGLSVQLYALRRRGDQGMGDLTTLGDLAAAAAARGAAMLAINPLHALFPGDRGRASPYYPSDRRFLDPIHLDLSAVPGAAFDADAAARLSRLGDIDYPAVWGIKAEALKDAFATGRSAPEFAAFVAAQGESLRRFALFEAIAETQGGRSWRDWPGGLSDPELADARAFAAAHVEQLAFHGWLQWLCERQLADASARAGGLALGLCRDLAVGAAPDGAELWSRRRLVAPGVSIGAPPDPFGPQGQVWGLPPFNPHHLRAEGYTAISELFASNMRHAGALRIDHVMGLARQFWVPDGAAASEGAYVTFPLHDLLGVLALESARAECLVIGEDLGTVPEGFRETLAAAGVLSYRVLPFERDGEAFKPPQSYPVRSMACVSTHDLPPLAGWWEGIDIAERLDLGLTPPEDAAAALAERVADKAALLSALADAGLIAAQAEPDRPLDDDLAAAIHAFIARSAADLALIQAEDLAGERTAVNLPGTDRERPNWRRRIGVGLEELFDGLRAQAILAAVVQTRG